jgi:hypothetical protein
MESASQSDNPPQRKSGKVADILGTLVALLTLTLPFVMIAYFSSSNIDTLPQSNYPLLKLRDK